MRLQLLHGPPGSLAGVTDGVVWRTCLREIAFTDTRDDGPGVPPSVEALDDGEAYALLLEVVCGLRSPLAGETQVMGQFRSFVSELGPDHARLRRFAQMLLTDARQIRARYLQGLGARAYGSQVRRHLSGADVVALVGGGVLATEIMPVLSAVAEVQQWLRATLANPATGPSSSSTTRIVVAAPVSAVEIGAVAGRYPKIDGIIDLRGEPNDGVPALGVPVIRLSDLFRDAERATADATRRLAAAREDIRQRSAAHTCRDELHPFGWEDLCA